MTDHEKFVRKPPVKQSSDRVFGVVFTVVFVLVGLWPLKDGAEARWWALGLAGLFLVTGLAVPRVLAPLNRAWARFGRVLHRVVNPVVMALLFFGVITPVGLLRRAFVRDPLRLARDPEAESYWIERDPPGPAPEAMKLQF
jgi:hypothetical protein